MIQIKPVSDLRNKIIEKIVNSGEPVYLSKIMTGAESDNLSEDILCIVYRTDVFEAGGNPIIDRHIDIEYSFGECYEICEDTSLFQYICTLCDLPLLQKEQETILYQREDAGTSLNMQ